MIKLLVLIGLTCGACAIVPPVGPQAGGAAVQILLSKTNDNKLDEKPRFAAAVKAAAAPAPGKPAPAPPPPAPAPAPAPAPVPVQVQPPAPLPTVTQAPPPPAIPVPKPVITPEFLQLFQAAFGRGATTTPPVTAPPTVANPFAQLFQSAMMPRMQLRYAWNVRWRLERTCKICLDRVIILQLRLIHILTVEQDRECVLANVKQNYAIFQNGRYQGFALEKEENLNDVAHGFKNNISTRQLFRFSSLSPVFIINGISVVVPTSSTI
ncbi:hypothetical protein KUTeg_002701 [Tegillarca granosa]|uniref:Uncharacterized protein n=1 Tax=Tegillarca granosa TaxID=220873 RepID=A0ABQ9FV37_TEGGR|nr:hypothetical protein KUTeg_002701 [Tegillarca granosa]